MYLRGIIFVATISVFGAAIAASYGPTDPRLRWLLVGMWIIFGINAVVVIRRAQRKNKAAN